MLVMTHYMRDMSRVCQRGMSRSCEDDFAGIIPHMAKPKIDQNLKAAILARVEARLARTGMTPRAASLRSGAGPDLIRDWQRGEAMPRPDSLASLAPILNTTPQWLAYGVGAEDASVAHDTGPIVPLVSWVAASRFADGPQVMDADAERMISAGPLSMSGSYMALQVSGDSMDRIAPDGSIIIVRTNDKDLVNRRFYVFASGDEATFKRYMTAPARLEPFSTNPAHEALPALPNYQVVGRVVRVISDV